MRLVLVVILMISLSGCTGQPAPDTAARVRHWIKTLREPDARRRKEAAFKLGNLGPTDPASVVPALRGALKDADATVRCEAILALVKLGTEGREALPALEQARRRDPSAQVRAYAARAAEKLRAEGEPMQGP
jgi:HEAT repeat protein